MRRILTVALFLLPLPALSDLSISEQAAASQRAITDQERQLRKIGCMFTPTNIGETIAITDEIVAPILTLPALTVLTFGEIVVGQTPGKYDITARPDLPNGGIAGKDFCAMVYLDGYPRPKAPGDPTMAVGLLFRSNLDMLDLYPNTGAEIMRRQQLKTLPAGKYVPIDLSQKAGNAWYSAFGGAWPRRSTARLGIRLDKVHYIPVDD
ncbi:MAG: hypothetical protein ACRBB0_20905 [Pelagimonas sp.]|uniref:hypothetical protein n=1 Tax=Pelagimonas sp. TaxID=2073170 RepID=UPI003D6C42ED